MCGGLALISDVGYILVQKSTTDQGWEPPTWLNGRTCMTAVALFVLFPLCLQRHMREVGACHQLLLSSVSEPSCFKPGYPLLVDASRAYPVGPHVHAPLACCLILPICIPQLLSAWTVLPDLQLEGAAAAGVVLVVGLIGLLGYEAFSQSFPAVHTGELPLWSLKVDKHLPEAFAVVGYAFYMQVGFDSGIQHVIVLWHNYCSFGHPDGFSFPNATASLGVIDEYCSSCGICAVCLN